jgi:aspartate carbamoyltransferase catalytic subunit
MFDRLCSFKDFKSEDILAFLNKAHHLKTSVLKNGWEAQELKTAKLVVQIFFEPSTRTRVSFELAAQRLNLRFSHFQMDESTSLAKGESIYDSLKVFEGLNPDLFIFRSKSDAGLNRFFENTKIPFVCAGLGNEYHPTQALLDVFTIQESVKKDLKDTRVVFVGDTKASRVVSSHIELSKLLGYKIIQCSDKDHSSVDIENIPDLNKSIEQSDVIIRLRTQKERGSVGLGDNFKIQAHHLKSKDKYLMHPGPFLRNEDFESDLPEHPQSLIWKQKENGLYVRAMVYKKIWSTL